MRITGWRRHVVIAAVLDEALGGVGLPHALLGMKTSVEIT